jgi:hypothetical protein
MKKTIKHCQCNDSHVTTKVQPALRSRSVLNTALAITNTNTTAVLTITDADFRKTTACQVSNRIRCNCVGKLNTNDNKRISKHFLTRSILTPYARPSFYRCTEQESLIAQKACIHRNIQWQLRCREQPWKEVGIVLRFQSNKSLFQKFHEQLHLQRLIIRLTRRFMRSNECFPPYFFNLVHIRQFPKAYKRQTIFNRSKNITLDGKMIQRMTTNYGNCRQAGQDMDGGRTETRKALILLWWGSRRRR